MKKLKNNQIAVLFFNKADLINENSKNFKSENIEITRRMLGIENSKKYQIRSLWDRRDIGIYDTKFIAYNILPHHDFFIILKPIK
jgi:hypothetical protein